MTTLIKNVRVALSGLDEPQQKFVLVDDNGRFSAIEDTLSSAKPDNVIDARGMVMLPGGIDPHVHFDEPGFTDREDFYHGTSAAASGGITTIIDMPCTSLPPVTNKAGYDNKLGIVSKRAVVDFAFYGGVSGNSLGEGFPQNMEELAPYVMGFKTYFLSGMDTFKQVELKDYPKVLKKAAELGKPVLLHAEDAEVVEAIHNANPEPENSPISFAASRPELAETEAVKKAVKMAKEAGADLHIVHIGTAAAADMLADSDKLTGETCPHYLAFGLDDFERIGSALKICPPIKPDHNRECLWDMVKDGRIDFMASDHAPAPEAQKKTGSIWTDYAGIPGTGTMYPYMISAGWRSERISLSRLTALMSENAAKRYGLWDKKGSIAVGKDADFVLYDMDTNHTVKGADFLSKGKVTPFEDMEFSGQIHSTFVRGTEVYNIKEGIKVQPGYGAHLCP